MKDEQKLSRRERQIMEIIHRQGPATVREINAALPDPPTEDSVRALLRILERKGRLVRQNARSPLTYAAAEPADAARRFALRRVLDTFFGGSLEAAVATFLSDEEAALSPEEWERLTQQIADARQKAKP